MSEQQDKELATAYAVGWNHCMEGKPCDCPFAADMIYGSEPIHEYHRGYKDAEKAKDEEKTS